MTPPSTVADTLDAAAELLSKPGAWTQGAYARDADGEDLLDANDNLMVPPEAVCFCLYGAVAYIEDDTVRGGEACQYLERLGISATEWNDEPERTQDEVVAKLREAAAKARGEVQP